MQRIPAEVFAFGTYKVRRRRRFMGTKTEFGIQHTGEYSPAQGEYLREPFLPTPHLYRLSPTFFVARESGLTAEVHSLE
jgi:hypothetical protein